MANNINAEVSEVWANELQTPLYETFVWKAFANTKFEGRFVGADTVHFPRQAKLLVKNIVDFTAPVVIDDLTATDEVFTLTERRYFAFQINIEEDVETYVDPRNQALKDVMHGFSNEYDTNIFSEYVNALYTLDDGDMDVATNGGAGNAVILDTNNMLDFIVKINQKFSLADVPLNDRKLAISPIERSKLFRMPELQRATSEAERRLASGLIGDVDGITIYVSNNIQTSGGWTVRNAMAVQGKPVSFAANIRPSVYVSTVDENVGGFWSVIKGATKFGTTLFTEGAERTMDCQIVV